MKLMVLDGNSIVNRAYYGIRPLTTGKNYTHIHSREINGLIGIFEFNQRHPISIGKQFLDFFLIGNRLGSCAGHCFYSTCQPFRKFGLIGSPCNLQCTFSHFS